MTTKGYNSKPQWLQATVALLMIAPVIVFLGALRSIGIEEWYKPVNWGPNFDLIPTRLWLIMASCHLAGVLLWVVRRWAFIGAGVLLILAAGAWIYNTGLNHDGSWFSYVVFAATPLAGVAVLVFSPFRAPYLEPRLRWWEQASRFKVDIPVFVEDYPGSAVLLDLSRTGMLIEFKGASTIAEPHMGQNLIVKIHDNLTLKGDVVRKEVGSCGIRFLGLDPQNRNALKSYIKELAQSPSKLNRKGS